MKCGKCSHEMMIVEVDEIEVDYCGQCESVWLDEGELDLLLEDKKSSEDLLNSLEVNNKSSEKKYHCPICSKKMNKVIAGDNVLIDECPKKCGLFFDKGELQEVISSTSSKLNKHVLNLLKEAFV